MNFFRLHKSHILAASITLLLNVVLILLLYMSSGTDLLSTITKNDTDNELAIQFQMLEQLSQQSIQPLKNHTATVENSQSKAIEKSETESEDRSDESVEQASPPVKDTILITELKKNIEEIKILLPEDTLTQKQQIPVQVATEMKQTITAVDKANKLREDNKFYYDNYRMIKNIRFLYPYVMKVKQVVNDMNVQLAKMTDSQQKKQLIKKTEKELFTQFEKDVRKMSYSQGKILLKLISRETNETAYGLIKTYKGGFPADFWYTVGLVFQENLKVKYDSVGEDALLEKVVRKYKQGELK